MEFMEGVTLIKEYTKLSGIGFVLKLVIIIIILVITMALSYVICIGGIALSKKKDSSIYWIIGLILTLVVWLTFHVATESVDIHRFIPEKFQEPIGEYEVVLDNDVDMNEFYKRYEIIDFEDGKYIIKFKEE